MSAGFVSGVALKLAGEDELAVVEDQRSAVAGEECVAVVGPEQQGGLGEGLGLQRGRGEGGGLDHPGPCRRCRWRGR